MIQQWLINALFGQNGARMDTFYDCHGQAVAYVDEDGQSVYTYGGEPVAWLDGKSMYSYSGSYLGWIQDGWVWDLSGQAVFFTDDASSGGPARPPHSTRPARSARSARPARGAGEVRSARAARSSSWSALSGEQFFHQ
jgi:hypothetical protein